MSAGIARAIMTNDPIEREAAINREVLLAAIMRQIFCQKTGNVLDVRTAVLTTIHRPEGEHGAAITASVIMTGDAFDANGGVSFARETAEKYHAAYEVTDGRDYRADGRLTVKAHKRMAASAA